jgi:flagellar hook-basal body complex protein FliE
MASPISSLLNVVQAPVRGATAAAAPAAKPGEFQSLLENAVYRVEGFRTQANQAVERLLSGEGEELHTALMATQRAELAFDLGLQVRNKVVDAYQEIMKMQL